MEELYDKLYALYESDVETEEGGDGFNYFSNEDERVQEVEALCCELLICDSGCNWKNIELLRKSGFFVYAGERDGFGWLTGCVRKKFDEQKRVLVYG